MSQRSDRSDYNTIELTPTLLNMLWHQVNTVEIFKGLDFNPHSVPILRFSAIIFRRKERPFHLVKYIMYIDYCVQAFYQNRSIEQTFQSLFLQEEWCKSPSILLMNLKALADRRTPEINIVKTFGNWLKNTILTNPSASLPAQGTKLKWSINANVRVDKLISEEQHRSLQWVPFPVSKMEHGIPLQSKIRSVTGAQHEHDLPPSIRIQRTLLCMLSQ